MGVEALPFRLALASASGATYWLGVLFQALRVRRRIGRSPNLKPRGPKERLLWAGWLVVIAVWIGQPLALGRLAAGPLLEFFGPLSGLAPVIAGAALLACGLAGAYWSYASLGDSWRMGIKARERTALVTAGPYAWVRHPIYAFQIMMLLGAACVVPTPLSLMVVGVQLSCCYVKARDEEAHLAGVHGQAYADYRARTGMFLPGLVRRGASSPR